MSERPRTSHKAVKLDPGFYAIRFGNAGNLDGVAILKAIATGGQGKARILGATCEGDVMLSQSAPMAVVHVEGGFANVAISLLLSEGAPSSGAVLDIERLHPERVKSPVPQDPSLVYLSGHVERTGDMKLPPGASLGSEQGTARVEGFAINWLKKRENLDIRYDCTFGARQETSTALGGGFVGSRQQAGAITSIWMELDGPEAENYDLQYAATFLKSGVFAGGQAKILSSRSEDDFLVGLTARVVKAGATLAAAPPEMERNVN